MPRRSNAVIAEILRQGRKQPRKHVLAALATGRVESNFQNLPRGDADSQGWRQERASLYRDPRNLKASVRRFYQEAAKLDRGQSAGDLAADVQRPAAQYRGRYAQHMGEAKKILGQGAGRTGGGGGGGGGTTPITLGDPGTAANVAALLTKQEPEKPRATATAPTASALLATPSIMPEGYKPLQTSAPVQPSESEKGGLEKLADLEDSIPAVKGGEPKPSRGSHALGGSGKTRLAPGGSYAGTTRPVVEIAKLAHSLGLQTTSAKRSTVNTASGGVSDHYEGNKHANARDLGGSVQNMDRAAVKIAKTLGIKGYKKGRPLVASVNRNGIRYQILYRTNTGGDHFDHIHVGAKRI